MLKKLLVSLIILCFSWNCFANPADFGIGNEEDIYMLSLTPESHFESIVAETVTGDISIDWSNATVCYSPDVGQSKVLSVLGTELNWFNAVHKKPLYDNDRLDRYDGNILWSVESNTYSLLQVRGEPGNSVFTLKGDKKQCDVILLSGFELSQLFYSDLREFVSSSGFTLLEKYKTIFSESLLNGFERYIEEEVARTKKMYAGYNTSKDSFKHISAYHANSISYFSFNELLADAEVIWKRRDIFEKTTNFEIGPINFELILSAKQFAKLKRAAEQKANDKKESVNVLYELGSGYFVKAREGYDNRDFELCSIANIENSESVSLILKQAVDLLPTRSFFSKDINQLFSYILREPNGCNLLLGNSQDLRQLETGFVRKKINYELQPIHIPSEKLIALDEKVSKEKHSRKVWEEELAKKHKKLMCGDVLTSLHQQCVETGESCFRWQFVSNSCG